MDLQEDDRDYHEFYQMILQSNYRILYDFFNDLSCERAININYQINVQYSKLFHYDSYLQNDNLLKLIVVMN